MMEGHGPRKYMGLPEVISPLLNGVMGPYLELDPGVQLCVVRAKKPLYSVQLDASPTGHPWTWASY